jgi:hypothetical protein
MPVRDQCIWFSEDEALKHHEHVHKGKTFAYDKTCIICRRLKNLAEVIPQLRKVREKAKPIKKTFRTYSKTGKYSKKVKSNDNQK